MPKPGRKKKAPGPAAVKAPGVKRKAPDAAGAPEPRAKRASAAFYFEGRLAEDAVAGVDASPELDGPDPESENEMKEEDAREFWGRFDNGLLYAWLADFDDSPVTPADLNDRAHLIHLLVSMNAPQPSSKAALKELQECWRKINAGTTKVAPGLCVKPASLLAPAAAPRRVASAHPLPAPSLSLHAAAVRSPPVARADDDELMLLIAVVAPVRTCLTCGTRALTGTGPAGPFNCMSCSLRGDVPFDAPENKFLAARQAPGSAAAASSTQSSSCQSPASTHSHASSLKPLDKEFARLSDLYGDFPLFLDKSSVSVKQAMVEVRQALGASATQLPSEHLVKLIQAGKLPNVGYALPRALALADEDTNLLGIVDGQVTASRGKVAPPPVQSAEAFCLALVSTILPSLVEQPKALVQWLSLARTVLAVAKRPGSSWASAMQYCDQLLQERIPQHEPFSQVSSAVLTTIDHASVAPAPRPPLAPVNSGPSPPVFCQSFNWQAGGCVLATCNQRHECQYGYKGCTSTASHRSSDCPHRNPNAGRSSGARGGGRATSASSVMSKAASTVAAAAAKPSKLKSSASQPEQ